MASRNALHMAFTFQDLFGAKKYGKDVAIVVQIVSLRINTLMASEIVVSDLSGSNGYAIQEGAPVVPPHNKKQLHLYKEKLMNVANKYRQRTGADLFSGQDVNQSKSSFISLFHKYCFVRLRLRLAVGQEPSVLEVDLASEDPQFDELWDRFRVFWDRVPLDNDLLVKMLSPSLRVDQYAFLLASAPSDSTNYSSQDSSRVKYEPDVKPEAANSHSQSYAFFSAALGPSESQRLPGPDQASPQVVSLETESSKVDSEPSLSGPAASESHNVHSSSQSYSAGRELESTQLFLPTQDKPRSPAHDLLTQVPQTFDPASHSSPGSPVLSTQDSHLYFDSSRVSMSMNGDSPGTKVSLSYLNQAQAAEDNYKVQAKIVGTIPSDLSLVCAKSYIEVNGEVVLSDPKIRSFQVILSDSPQKQLSARNSLLVQVPSAQVLSFFGYKYTEQLYTRMDSLEKELSALYFIDLELEVSRSMANQSAKWKLDTSLEILQSKVKRQ